MMDKIQIQERCESFFNQFDGDVRAAVTFMYTDMDEFNIVDPVATKLLRLASCPSSPVGERTNAARSAFKRIAKNFN